jgi:hypothetical protein
MGITSKLRVLLKFTEKCLTKSETTLLLYLYSKIFYDKLLDSGDLQNNVSSDI